MSRTDEAPALDAVILDLDGVVTQTAEVHERAWKRVFDPVLARRGLPPFSGEDYRRHVDGKPRYEGAGTLLASRGVDLPRGDPDDPPDRDTICGIGNRKNAVFRELLEGGGARVFDDAVAFVRGCRARAVPTAVVSASKNARAVLAAANLTEVFDVVVDGEDAVRLDLAGKPAGDTFVHAARALGVAPERAAVLEDAVAGVEAGRAGGFAVVVGVARGRGAAALRAAGADVVVSSLEGLDPARARRRRRRPIAEVPRVSDDPLALDRRLRAGEPAVFLDYDGTLTPIVNDPDRAVLDDGARRVVAELAERMTVAIVSGRDRRDVERRVGIPEIFYAGSHGFDIAGPGYHLEHEAGARALPALDAAEAFVRERAEAIPGAIVERKRFSVAVHYRMVPGERVGEVARAADEAAGRWSGLRVSLGKKVFELGPDVDWDKGRAVTWLTRVLELDRAEVIPVFFGDDVTDENAFRVLGGDGVGVLVGEPEADATWADFRAADTGATLELLRRIGGGAPGTRGE